MKKLYLSHKSLFIMIGCLFAAGVLALIILLTFQKSPDSQAPVVIQENKKERLKDTYDKNYAFKLPKTVDELIYNFGNGKLESEKEAIDYISKVNAVKKVLNINAEAYNEKVLNRKTAVYQFQNVTCTADKPVYESEKDSKDLEVFVKQYLDSKLGEVKLDRTFSEIQPEDDYLSSYIDRIYFQKYNDTKIINLGKSLHANEYKSSLLKDISISGGRMCSLSSGAEQASNFYGYAGFQKALSDGLNSSIFMIEFLPDVEFDAVDLNDVTKASIEINDIAISYLWIEEQKTLVPILELKSVLNTGSKTYPITFWVWGLKD